MMCSGVAFGDVYALSIHPSSIDSSDDGVQWLGGIDSLSDAIRKCAIPVIMSGREVSAGQMIRATGLVSINTSVFALLGPMMVKLWERAAPSAAPSRNGTAPFQPRARRAKRTVDVAMALLVLLAFPVFMGGSRVTGSVLR